MCSSDLGPENEDTVIGQVSLRALIEAATEGCVMLHRAGGIVEIQVARVATGFPNERVTAAASVQWKDRTDARPQSEGDGAPVATTRGAEGAGTGRRARIDALAERDGWECHLCGAPLELAADGPMAITFDHLVPRSQGGGSALDNLALAHWKCNNERGNAPLEAADSEAEVDADAEPPAVDESSVPAHLREA